MRILVAMSGGVDSSVAAACLLKEGHEVEGAYMKNWINEDNITGNCPWQQDIDDASAVANFLGIDFHVVNMMKEYRERIVHYLLKGYQDGITPNPDVMCNREMKFGVFLDYAIKQGFDAVATGHYARVQDNEDGTKDILCGSDSNKNQTYFLAMLDQRQASKAVFPIGHLLKKDLRSLASELGLPNAGKKDSQGICFIGEIKMSDFLRNYVSDSPGNIVNLNGEILGQHRGLHLYTLGQRKGIGIPSNVYKEAFVVVEKNIDENELIVGFDSKDTPRLYASRCLINGLSFVNRVPQENENVFAQPRYRTPAVSARIHFSKLEEGKAELVFDEPQRALTPGQICAFYSDEVLLGGGFFESIDYS